MTSSSVSNGTVPAAGERAEVPTVAVCVRGAWDDPLSRHVQLLRLHVLDPLNAAAFAALHLNSIPAQKSIPASHRCMTLLGARAVGCAVTTNHVQWTSFGAKGLLGAASMQAVAFFDGLA